MITTDSHRALVVVAAGSGVRLGHGIPKAAVPLTDRTILSHALDAVTAELNLRIAVLVLPPGDEQHGEHYFEELSTAAEVLSARGIPTVVVTGGRTRAASVAAGVESVLQHLSITDSSRVQVLIHDAARALTPTAVFHRVFAALEAGAEAAVPALPVTDTIKQVDTTERVKRTVPREDLRAVQTPQGFTLDLLRRTGEHLALQTPEVAQSLTDEAMIAEDLGADVVVVPGDPRALKITSHEDLLAARALLDAASPPLRGTSAPIPRVGIGHDVHALAAQDEPSELWLAGLHWPGERGLTGHSDGDAVAHACCDALFSAAGIGDLGVHFGTGRPELAGASGVRLLAEAARIVRGAGFVIGSISVQFIGSRPIFGPRRAEAQQALTQAAGAPVAVAATTSDGLGFTGRGEGIFATATAVVLAAP